ncbi:MAG: B12-binding domain-containing radical SAM protein [Chloroflexi bacterium]|nr:B12-binding domain-containing radical SAM protein [Chloroflexota bacterium]
MKILLVQPRQMGKLGFRGLSVIEPLALETIAACLPDHDVRIVDFLPDNRIDQPMNEFQPDVVGVSCCFTMDVYQSLDIARQAKQFAKKPFVVMGGHHPTLNPQDFAADFIDAIVMGEGEITTPELMDCLAAGGDLHNVPGLTLNENGAQVNTGVRPLMDSINDVPIPRRDLTAQWRDRYYLVMEKPLAVVETARGCPHKCNFCSVWRFYQGKCRYRQPERVVQELASLQEDILLFTDDNFLLNVNRAMEIARLIKEAGIKKRYFFQARSDTITKHPEVILAWKDIGLGGVFVGMEKISEEELAAVHKNNSVENNTKTAQFLRSLNLGLTAAFIVDPTYTKDDFQKLRTFIRRWKIATPSFSVLTPLPGTELFNEVKDKIQTTNYELYDLLHSVLPTKMDLNEFYGEFAKLYGSAYTMSKFMTQGVVPFIWDLLQGKKTLKHVRWIAEVSKSLTDPNVYLGGHKAVPRSSNQAG